MLKKFEMIEKSLEYEWEMLESVGEKKSWDFIYFLESLKSVEFSKEACKY